MANPTNPVLGIRDMFANVDNRAAVVDDVNRQVDDAEKMGFQHLMNGIHSAAALNNRFTNFLSEKIDTRPIGVSVIENPTTKMQKIKNGIAQWNINAGAVIDEKGNKMMKAAINATHTFFTFGVILASRVPVLKWIFAPLAALVREVATVAVAIVGLTLKLLAHALVTYLPQTLAVALIAAALFTPVGIALKLSVGATMAVKFTNVALALLIVDSLVMKVVAYALKKQNNETKAELANFKAETAQEKAAAAQAQAQAAQAAQTAQQAAQAAAAAKTASRKAFAIKAAKVLLVTGTAIAVAHFGPQAASYLASTKVGASVAGYAVQGFNFAASTRLADKAVNAFNYVAASTVGTKAVDAFNYVASTSVAAKAVEGYNLAPSVVNGLAGLGALILAKKAVVKTAKGAVAAAKLAANGTVAAAKAVRNHPRISGAVAGSVAVAGAGVAAYRQYA